MGDAPASPSPKPAYAGDVSAPEAWDGLAKNPAAQLVDVRTDAEWNFVGAPELRRIGRQTLFCQWQHFPKGEQNPTFVAETKALLARAGHRQGAPLYFLCRSGARSRAAAIAMTAAGLGPCFNVASGFEGNLDTERHRGEGGWKAEGLPWTQS